MRGAGTIKEFLVLWLNKLTDNINSNFTLPVASSLFCMPTNVPQPQINNIAKLDSGTSNHYLKLEHKNLLTNIHHVLSKHTINLPDNKTIQATKQGNLLLHPSLNSKATTALILPQLTIKSLISIGQLCDNDCTVVFKKLDCVISHNNR